MTPHQCKMVYLQSRSQQDTPTLEHDKPTSDHHTPPRTTCINSQKELPGVSKANPNRNKMSKIATP